MSKMQLACLVLAAVNFGWTLGWGLPVLVRSIIELRELRGDAYKKRKRSNSDGNHRDDI